MEPWEAGTAKYARVCTCVNYAGSDRWCAVHLRDDELFDAINWLVAERVPRLHLIYRLLHRALA